MFSCLVIDCGIIFYFFWATITKIITYTILVIIVLASFNSKEAFKN